MFVRLQVLIIAKTMLLALIDPSDQFTPILDWTYKHLVMVYVDGRYRHPETQYVDTFFDRVISISIKLNNITGPRFQENVVTGVLITEELALTSFNAFRKVSREDDSFHGLHIQLIRGRYMQRFGVLKYYNVFRESDIIVCAREVMPNVFNVKYPSHMHHGIHRPLHDLMVMRLKIPFHFHKPVPEPRFDLNYKISNNMWDYNHRSYLVYFGPILSKLAEKNDVFESSFQFASIGHVNDEHIEVSRYLESERYTIYDKVIVDCDEWIPKEWGYFICILNTRDFRGIASGAVLYSGDKLFGIGAFALWRGEAGILAFTDVRPYTSLIFNTCTKEDQGR